MGDVISMQTHRLVIERKDARIAALEAALEAVLDDIAGKDGGLGLLQRTVLEHAERTLRGEGGVGVMQETTIGVERCIQCGTMLGCIKYGLNDKYPLCSACATPINTPMHPYHPAYSWKNRGDVLADINEELRARIAALEAALRTVKACLRGSDALGIVTEVREDGSLGPSIEDVIERALRGEDNGG